jgi:hypothetical protein
MFLIRFSRNGRLLIRCKENLQIRCFGREGSLIRFSRNRMLLIRCKEKMGCRLGAQVRKCCRLG